MCLERCGGCVSLRQPESTPGFSKPQWAGGLSDVTMYSVRG